MANLELFKTCLTYFSDVSVLPAQLPFGEYNVVSSDRNEMGQTYENKTQNVINCYPYLNLMD